MPKIYKALFLLCLLFATIENNAQLIANGWYNTRDFIFGNTSSQYVTSNVEFLANDSNAIWVDGAGNKRPFETYGTGHIFDLLLENWAAVPSDHRNPVSPLPIGCQFFWDSLRFNYFYYRDSLDNQTVDTLIITTYINTNNKEKQINTDFFAITDSTYSRMAFLNTYNFYWQSGGRFYKKDTLLLTNANAGTINAKRSLTIPIQAHVGDGIRSTSLPSRTFNDLLGYSMVFKSGTTYLPGDTVFSFKKNKTIKGGLFGVYSSSINEKGAVNQYVKNYAENSLWLSKNNRYGGYEKGFFGFVPGKLHQQIKSFDCEVFITANCKISVPEVDKTKSAHIVNTYPNPATKNGALKVAVHSKKAANYALSIKNILGQTVYTTFFMCDNNADVNLDVPLQNIVIQGVYYFVLTDDETNEVADVKKMIVNE